MLAFGFQRPYLLNHCLGRIKALMSHIVMQIQQAKVPVVEPPVEGEGAPPGVVKSFFSLVCSGKKHLRSNP